MTREEIITLLEKMMNINEVIDYAARGKAAQEGRSALVIFRKVHKVKT